MTKKRKLNLPLEYQITQSFDPERFTKLRIKVMHSGLNLNNSYFGSEAIEKAKPTLANVPILAFIKKEDGTSNEDFAGHEFEIKITEDDMKYVYLGRPIGIVPETNNYTLETDEDGKQFVIVDAYVWNQYANSALDIINRDKVKKVSMEVIVDKYDWEESYINILDYSYTGIAMLGENVREAMIGAKAELINYSQNTISDMFKELKAALEGGQEGMILEESVVGITECTTTGSTTFSKENEIVFTPTDTTETVPEEKEEEKFEEKEEEKEEEKFEEKEEEKFEEKEEEKFEEKEETLDPINYEVLVADLQSKIEILQTENARLQEFVNATHEKAKEDAINELFARFADLGESEEAKQLKENAKSMKLSDIETQLYALRGKLISYSQASNKEEVDSWKKLIYKYNKDLNAPAGQPEWADLVAKHQKED